MNDESKDMAEYHERVTKVETQMAYVLVEQSNLRTILDKHNALIEALAKQTIAQDYQTRVVIERTEQHNKEIERLQSQNVDTGKLLVEMGKEQTGTKLQLKILQYVAGVLVTLLLGYVFSVILTAK